MSKNCGHKVPCGCGDSALSTPPPCNESGDCAGEPCAEVFCEDCIAHCSDDISVYTGAASGNLDVAKGARWNTILEQLMLTAAGMTLAKAPLGLKVKSKTSTSVTITFEGDPATTYDCEVEDQDTSATYNVAPTHLGNGKFEVTVTGLATNALTPTHQAVIGGGGASSVTLKFNII